MKSLCIVVVLLVVLAACTSAVTSAGLNLSIGGGMAVPLQDLKTYWKAGASGAAVIGYKLTPGFEPALRYAMSLFPSRGERNETFAKTYEDMTLKEFAGEIRAHLTPPGFRMRPYGLAGAGAAWVPNKGRFYYYIGGGIRAALMPRLDLFMEGRYAVVSIGDYTISYIPLNIGISLAL